MSQQRWQWRPRRARLTNHTHRRRRVDDRQAVRVGGCSGFGGHGRWPQRKAPRVHGATVHGGWGSGWAVPITQLSGVRAQAVDTESNGGKGGEEGGEGRVAGRDDNDAIRQATAAAAERRVAAAAATVAEVAMGGGGSGGSGGGAHQNVRAGVGRERVGQMGGAGKARVTMP